MPKKVPPTVAQKPVKKMTVEPSGIEKPSSGIALGRTGSKRNLMLASVAEQAAKQRGRERTSDSITEDTGATQ